MNLVERVKRLLLQPQEEWQVIDTEPVDIAALYKGYIAPLAAIGPVCSLIGMWLIGITVPMMGTFRVPFGAALAQSVVHYVLTLAGVYIVAMIIDALAPTFGAQRSMGQALKLAAYASTASWVAGVVMLIPALGLLGLLAALYSLYLLYLGMPVLMRVPQDKVVGYTAVVVISAVVLFVVVGSIGNLFISMPAPMLPGGAMGHN